MTRRGVKFEPTPEQRYTVEVMSTGGIAQETIAAVLQIDEKTLRKHFRQELDNGKAKMLTKVVDSLLRQALAGSVGAACFILKCQGGWREQPQGLNLTGANGGPIEVAVSAAVRPNFAAMTDEELDDWLAGRVAQPRPG